MFEINEVQASTTKTANGESGEIPINSSGRLNDDCEVPLSPDARFYLNVSAASGTSPTLDVDIVKTINGIDFILKSFAQKVTTGQEVIEITNCPKQVKAVFTITGTTPSFTFEVQQTR